MMGSVDVDERGRLRTADKVMNRAEDIIYLGIAALLVLASGVLLVVAVDELLDVLDGLGPDPVVEVLDTLLLLFIFVELLSAVRATVATRGLVAEPFLLVGIIASIKEIVVLSVKAAEDIGSGAKFQDQLWEIGVLAVVVLLLGITAWLLRSRNVSPTRPTTRDHRPPKRAMERSNRTHGPRVRACADRVQFLCQTRRQSPSRGVMSSASRPRVRRRSTPSSTMRLPDCGCVVRGAPGPRPLDVTGGVRCRPRRRATGRVLRPVSARQRSLVPNRGPTPARGPAVSADGRQRPCGPGGRGGRQCPRPTATDGGDRQVR